ncbi:hypothetical protein B7P43_G08423 [Cryptotermes secundus]|uniref:Uncharacterized protein n=1 Tax=Cryptotermes secundus TaxID=105785 RepID=A0A2J7QNN5_9NEOP|nr:hypothetical protein B7P43_G08423 [Cryptotermes secundus]
MYRAGSLRAVVEEISEYKIDLLGIQLQVFFVHKRIISAVKSVEFVSNRMSYITLRGRCCDIIVLNVHVPTEDKIDDVKDRIYEKLEHVHTMFPHRNTHKFTWTSPDGKMHNQIDHILIDRRRHSSIPDLPQPTDDED